jgi:hypothetical protein
LQFDVPGWLATLVGCTRDELAFLRETDKGDYLSVSYTRDGSEIATVDLVARPLGDPRRATWHLLALIGERVETVQVPAQTRFIWR